MSRARVVIVGALLAFSPLTPSGQSTLPPTGVLVEAVEAASPAASAGLRPGDILLDSPDPWSFEQFAIERAPRATTAWKVQRDGVVREIPFPVRTSRLGLTIGSTGAATDGRTAVWARVRSGDRLAAAREFEAAAREYQRALGDPAIATDSSITALVHGRIGALAQRRSRWDEALASLSSAMSLEPAGARTLTRATWLLQRAAILRTRGSYDDAAAAAQDALSIRRELAGGSWDEAAALSEIANINLSRRRLDAAWDDWEAARRLVAATEHSTFEVSRIDFNLCLVDARRGRISEAEARLNTVIDVTSRLAPESVEHARSLNAAGIFHSQNGQLPDAETNFVRALAIHEKLDPGGSEEASVTNNLGILAMQRGRFADAERYYRRSLALKERLGLSPLDRALTIGNLGLMSIERRDLESARSYLRQGLALVRQVAPEGPEAANAFNNLARVERLAGNFTDAERLARDGLAIRTRLSPDSVLVAFSLSELGKVLEAANQFGEAEESHRRALDIRQRLLPDGTNAADSLDALGRLAQRQRRFDEAADLHAKAGAIWQRMTPGGAYEAVNLIERARVEQARGRRDDALALYARATDVFDGVTGSVGGSFETQADFRSALATYYAEHAASLIEAGRHGEAFHVSERARARAFMALLAERDLTFSADVPAPLDSRKRALTRDYERAQAELSSLSPIRDAEKIEEPSRRLREVRLELAAANAEIARSVPRLASVHTAEPLGAGAAQKLLNDETTAISYVVGERVSHAFVLTRSSLDVFEVPLGRQALDERVRRFLRLVERRDDASGALAVLARELYRALVAPAEAQIARGRRLLVVPDGALHALPFAALVRDRADASRDAPAYLVEWRPLHQVPSLTVYAQLRAHDAVDLRSVDVIAVGDPRYTVTSGSSGAILSALPGSRREVESIRGVYGARTRTLLERDATEAQVRGYLEKAGIVHIAAHGLINERFPLDSALAFSTPEAADSGDNGMLQAWEIIDQLRLWARVVVLSACDTAGTGDGTGEGLLGLSRAFQIAGAPSVVASLWRVPDEMTPALMRNFHRHVRDGASLSDALARAQRVMLRDPSTAHPYNWASFVLNGRN
jgi:CHAT domain-containing protein/Tfp pilus assembly protein PilF